MKFSRRNDIGDEDDGELASVEYVAGSLRARITPASRKRRLAEQQSIATEKEAFPVGKKKAEEKEQRAKQEEEIPLSEKRRALFEPLVASTSIHGHGDRSVPAESLLPPPDFDSATYPRGWVVGKRRKLVNVDVVESMRRVAILEMNRKDLEINGLNEQLEEDARCIEHLQRQLLQERSKRAEAEREKSALQDHVNILMDMLHSNEEECVEESVDVA